MNVRNMYAYFQNPKARKVQAVSVGQVSSYYLDHRVDDRPELTRFGILRELAVQVFG
jgi:hypothetical protein